MTKWVITIHLRRKYTIRDYDSRIGGESKNQFLLIREENLPLWKTNGYFVKVCQPCYMV